MNYYAFSYLNSPKVKNTTDENKRINNGENRCDWYNIQ
jgi:hypothetical protein